tara:strand:- start:528 stop:659 length:132 start_codon:yes stop_codon:yes gene_type:complete
MNDNERLIKQIYKNIPGSFEKHPIIGYNNTHKGNINHPRRNEL